MSATQLASLGASETATKVNFVELVGYAERSKLAYASEAAILQRYPGTVRVSSAGQTAIQYFLDQNRAAKTQYISVRGTANKKNFSEDFKIRKRKDTKLDIPVHAGFDLAAQAIYADMRPYLNANYKTYVTGHSLGGAIAALLSLYLIEDGFKVERIVTFGQPRFTTNVGAKHLGDVPIFRVVDENDLVPMVPPSSAIGLNGYYEHVGSEVILLDGTNYVFLPQHDATRISVGEFWRSTSFEDLEDHKIDNYLARLSPKTSRAVQVPYNKRENYSTAAR